MRFMNDYDLIIAERRFGNDITPNRLALTRVVQRLAEWADDNSDGWAYWPRPARAANKAMGLIESTTNQMVTIQESRDVSQAEARLALRPIKAFLTSQQVSAEDRSYILAPAEDLT